MAVSERHCIFLVMVTKMYSDGHYLSQISLPFHQGFYSEQFVVSVSCLAEVAKNIYVELHIFLAYLEPGKDIKVKSVTNFKEARNY